MTPEQPESTYFDGIDPSQMEWADIFELGKSIASQLELDEADTLSRWMAFRLAELINRGDADDSAKDEVSELILRVWHRRSDWPNGWPPRAASSQAAWLFDTENHLYPRSEVRRNHPMQRVVKSLTQEYRLWLRLTTDRHLPMTPTEEAMLALEPIVGRGTIQRLLELNDVPDTEPNAPDAMDELESILQARRTLLQNLLESDDNGESEDSDTS